ncbi:MAG: hypothetical protein EHM67_00045 [Hyphomicrobiaceae bacterium]|jgi:hypothetical protein|nr:MAG: hypothetical protein EHM67_00045 [Hyphomicrobiaceae bacterium]
MTDLYFYRPLPAFPHIYKCAGICTAQNVTWFLRENPGTVALDGYHGDKVTDCYIDFLASRAGLRG